MSYLGKQNFEEYNKDLNDTESQEFKRHYWFSKKQAKAMIKVRKNRGEKSYKTYATINGKKVRVSWCTKKKFHETAWEDIVYLGVGVPFGIEEME